MKKIFIFGTVLIAALVVFYLTETSVDSTSHKLRFLSLAWQEQSVANIRAVIREWNSLYPDQEVEYIQGTWNSVHDYLITSFETGDVPDVFHYESAIIVDFALRGYLTDLSPYLSAELRDDIMPVAWKSVTASDNRVYGIPFLVESFVVLYNKDLFAKGGVIPPTSDKPWTWEDLEEAARRLTLDSDHDGITDQYGVGMGLRNSANILMNLSISFGGSFFYRTDGHYQVKVGGGEKKLLQNIMNMLYRDKTMMPSSIGKTGTEMIPTFLSGKIGMLVAIGAWARQQVAENAPSGFNWGVFLPPLAQTQNIGINTQTYSIPVKSKRKDDAFKFIEFLVNRENMARAALTDWMLPARKSCLEMPEFNNPQNGWDVVKSSVNFLSTGEWLGFPGYAEWKIRVANPVLQSLFSNHLTVNQAAQRIEYESDLILSRYQLRNKKW